ncbi:rhomboid-domain-containing protein [Dichomitus squalens]|uniref:Rhomboid-domain-containing protein n=1 Tax=Dichomitus squalens TaxID=114155 RepID=A0A4Q9MWL2_9APHY|nr:rhomboid-domain-containing protein [Dichomitus squalens]
MKRSLLSISPLLSSARLCSGPLQHGTWLGPRICTSVRHSTLSTGALRQPLTLLRTPPSVSQGYSVLRFVAGTLLRATHRSGLNRSSRGGSGGYGGGPNGPWQRFRDRLNAIPGNVLFWGIIGLNGVVFVSWQWAWAKYKSMGDASSYIWMRNHFIASADNIKAGRWYTLLTACFSHADTSHILFNGFTFYFVAPLVISILGNAGFLSLYLGGGIVSSLAGIAWRNYKQGNQPSGSHGASGAIYSVISFFACVAPTATFYLFGVLPLPAWGVVTGIFLWDGYSAMNEHRLGTDTAGHIGGLLAGIGYFIAKRFRVF